MLGYYYKELARCKALLGAIGSTVSTLSSVNSTYQDMESSVATTYMIDNEETTIHKKIVFNNSKIEKVKNRLSGPVTAKVNMRIAELEALIQEELRRIAEAAAAAAAASRTSRGAR